MDTFCNAASAGMAPSWDVSAYILPLGSWSPKRLIGMLTSSAVTSKVLSTGPPARQEDVVAPAVTGARAVGGVHPREPCRPGQCGHHGDEQVGGECVSRRLRSALERHDDRSSQCW